MPILLLTLQKNVFWCISRVNNAPSDISFYGLFMTVNFEKCIESIKVAEGRPSDRLTAFSMKSL